MGALTPCRTIFHRSCKLKGGEFSNDVTYPSEHFGVVNITCFHHLCTRSHQPLNGLSATRDLKIIRSSFFFRIGVVDPLYGDHPKLERIRQEGRCNQASASHFQISTVHLTRQGSAHARRTPLGSHWKGYWLVHTWHQRG